MNANGCMDYLVKSLWRECNDVVSCHQGSQGEDSGDGTNNDLVSKHDFVMEGVMEFDEQKQKNGKIRFF